MIKRAFLYLSRGKFLTLASIAAITSTYLATALYVVSGYASNQVLRHYEKRAPMVAFFKDEASEADIFAVKARLEASGKVGTVTYTSKEQALKNYVSRFQEDPSLLESISQNILPASLDVQAKELSYLPELENMLKQESFVEDVWFKPDIVDKLRRLTTSTRTIGVLLIGLLSASSVFVVVITIALMLHARKDEIEIMRLVGATRWQVRAPFLIQGMILGFFAALFSGIAMGVALPSFGHVVEETLLFGASVLDLFPREALIVGSLGHLALGTFIGGLGSYIATLKYLR